MKGGHWMTVAELIAALQAMPQGMKVSLEGCCGWGNADGVKVIGDFVLITEVDGEED